MKAKMKENHIKKFAFGLILAWVVTLMLTGITALLIKNETVSISGEGIYGLVTCLLAGFISTLVVTSGSEKRAVVALVNGSLYYASMLIFALLFTNKLNIKILIDLPVIMFGSIIGAMCYRRKRRGVPHIK